MELKALVCPQCGSADIEQLTEVRCRCKSCDSTFLIEDGPEDKNFCPRIQLPTVHTKEDFLRAVWQHISLDNPTEEIYDCDLSEITLTQREILVGSGDGRVDIQASIGYRREETYLDTERYYDRESQSMKERPVTKTRKVTDWQPYGATVTEAASAAVTNDAAASWESSSLFDRQDGFGTEQPGGTIRPQAQKKLEDLLLRSIGRAAEYDLPGDDQKDVSWTVSCFSAYGLRIYIAPEYTATLTCGGKTVRYSSYAFDRLSVSGSGSFRGPDTAEQLIRQKRDSVPQKIERRANPPLLLSVAALVASILVSLFVRSNVISLILFGVAVAVFIRSQISCNRIERSVRKAVETECEQIEKADEQRRLSLLNRKLAALGLQTVSDDEAADDELLDDDE